MQMVCEMLDVSELEATDRVLLLHYQFQFFSVLAKPEKMFPVSSSFSEIENFNVRLRLDSLQNYLQSHPFLSSHLGLVGEEEQGLREWGGGSGRLTLRLFQAVA